MREDRFARRDLGSHSRLGAEREGFADEQQQGLRRPDDRMTLIDCRLAWARNYSINIGALGELCTRRLGDRLVSVLGLPFDAAFTEAAAEPVDDTTQADEARKSVSVGSDTFVADGRRGNQFAGLVPKQVVPPAVE